MSPADRTAQEIAKIRRAMGSGKMTPDKAAPMLKALEARGASYEARWELPNGKERIKTFSVKKYGKLAEKKAEQYEALMKAQVGAREHSDPLLLRTTVADVLTQYRDHMKGRESFRNVRSHVSDIIEVWGDRLSLERLDRDPDGLIQELRTQMEAKHAIKTAWQRKVTAQAAIGRFIKKKRLRLVNPFPGADWPQPESKRDAFPYPEDYRDLMAEADRLKKDGSRVYPWWGGVLITLGWTHALRTGEFQSWRWEWTVLEPTGGDRFPYVRTLVEKQHKKDPIFREIPLYKEAAEALRRAPVRNKETGPIFPRRRSATDKLIRKIFNAAGKEHLTFHDFRRSFDRNHPELTTRERMELLGHATEKASNHYRQQLERRKMEALVAGSYEPENT